MSTLLALLASVAACWFVAAPTAIAQVATAESQREYNVKAASLYAFGRYVTWPESAFPAADSPFVIGVLGADPFGGALQQIAAKKTIANRKIVVRQISATAEAASCHIVFVLSSTKPETESELFRATAGQPVLLVGESTGFNERGGIANFYEIAGNVRFELNPQRGELSQLSLGAKLLSLGAKAQATP